MLLIAVKAEHREQGSRYLLFVIFVYVVLVFTPDVKDNRLLFPHTNLIRKYGFIVLGRASTGIESRVTHSCVFGGWFLLSIKS
jgi:hypothetical protein